MATRSGNRSASRKKTAAEAYRSVNPYDGKVLKIFDIFSAKQLEQALKTAAGCCAPWRHLGFAKRGAIARKAATILRARPDEFARPVTLEMGKLIAEARAEVALSADIIYYYAQHAEQFLTPRPLHPTSGEAIVENVPFGVLLGVQPWNFPYYQLARFAAPNLMAGNVVLVKHAACVPQCALAFEKLWLEAGAPAGAYTNLPITHEQVLQVIDDPRVRGVALTGGVDAARDIAARAGKNLKKSTMELGGNDAFIVLEDADLDRTVKWALAAKMGNMGQSCVAAKRFIVVDKLADRFLKKFQAALTALRPGSPLDPATTLGPVATEGGLRQLLAQVKRAVEHGAEILLGGTRLPGPGCFLAPTLLTNVQPSNPAYREEIFGPVALFFRVKNEDEAIALANDSDYGLGAAVFTPDIARAKRVAARLTTGMVFINHPTGSEPDLPFGGVKNSGYGRELNSLGIQEFVSKKLIRLQTIRGPA